MAHIGFIFEGSRISLLRLSRARRRIICVFWRGKASHGCLRIQWRHFALSVPSSFGFELHHYQDFDASSSILSQHPASQTLDVLRSVRDVPRLARGIVQEARNISFCPSQEKFHTIVLNSSKSLYETSPEKVQLAYFSPPEGLCVTRDSVIRQALICVVRFAFSTT